MPTPEQIIQKVNSKVVINDPFFAKILLNLTPKAMKCKKLKTEGRNLGFNEEWLTTTAADDIEFKVLEITMANALGHPWRRSGREKQTWNRSSDQVVWHTMQAAGKHIPPEIRKQIDPRFADKAIEEVYSIMIAEQPEGGGGGGKPQPPDPNGPKEPGQSPKGKQKGQKQEGEDGKGKKDKQQEEPPQQGEGEGDQEQEDQPDFGDTEIGDPEQDDFNQSEADMKRIVAQALSMGSVPGNLKKLIGEAIKDIVDWRSITLRWMQQIAAEDYTWRQPNRRYIPSGLYLPSMRSEKMGVVVIANDASGSVWHVQEEFATEMSAILREVRPEITHVIYFDTRIVKHDEYLPDDQLSFDRCGGGGTSFRPIFDWIEKNDIQPVGLIVLTDLEGQFPPEAPNYPVLWASTIEHPAPFGDVVKVSLERINKS